MGIVGAVPTARPVVPFNPIDDSGGLRLKVSMPRQLRIEYDGACYHLVNRGDRRESIFLDEPDYLRFLASLDEVCRKTGWRVHAYCLLANHFHLVLETPQANLVAGMKWLLGTYTTRFNRHHRLSGHLFAGRYKSLLIDGSGLGFLRNVCDYVHLNPSRARLLATDQPLRTYLWSSFRYYLAPPAERPVWLGVEPVFVQAGVASDDAAGRREFEQQLEVRRAVETSADWRTLRRGWFYGSEECRQEILRRLGARSGARLPGSARGLAEEQAEAILRAELAARRWQESDLLARRKADPEKLEIARRLRRETTVSLKWVAARLRMGAWTYLANSLYADSPTRTTASDTPARRHQRSRNLERSDTREDSSAPPTERIETTQQSGPDPANTNPAAPFVEELPVHCL